MQERVFLQKLYNFQLSTFLKKSKLRSSALILAKAKILDLLVKISRNYAKNRLASFKKIKIFLNLALRFFTSTF